MPTYDYECKKCDEVFEVFQSITAPKLEACPTCGAPIRRLLGTGSGIVLKGTGWYQTDFKNQGAAPKKPAEGKTTSIDKPGKTDKKADAKDVKPSSKEGAAKPKKTPKKD